jgi:hypothetical protein
MSTEAFNWPKKGLKAFVSTDQGEVFHLPSIGWSFPQHAGAFKEAADIIVASRENPTDSFHRDALPLPVCYLYRHCLEVKLKDLVEVGIWNRFFEKEQVQEVLDDHSLAKLWTQVKKLLQHRWPDGDEGAMKSVESVINQFHEADSRGQAFRYDHNKETRRPHRHEKLPTHISLINLRTAVDAVYSFLDASEGMLRDEMSNSNS